MIEINKVHMLVMDIAEDTTLSAAERVQALSLLRAMWVQDPVPEPDPAPTPDPVAFTPAQMSALSYWVQAKVQYAMAQHTGEGLAPHFQRLQRARERMEVVFGLVAEDD